MLSKRRPVGDSVFGATVNLVCAVPPERWRDARVVKRLLGRDPCPQQLGCKTGTLIRYGAPGALCREILQGPKPILSRAWRPDRSPGLLKKNQERAGRVRPLQERENPRTQAEAYATGSQPRTRSRRRLSTRDFSRA